MAGTIKSGVVVRKLLRQTRMLAERASNEWPFPWHDDDGVSETYLILPPPSPSPSVESIAALTARAEQAEHAAAWLRARLRAERRRPVGPPPIDVASIVADLAPQLSRLREPRVETVERIVARVLSAHGLSLRIDGVAVDKRGIGRRAVNLPLVLPGWTEEQQEAVAAQALARTPDIQDTFYVYRALGAVAAHANVPLEEIARATSLGSGMARRRLRLALEALCALGVLVVRGNTYALNPDYRPPRSRKR